MKRISVLVLALVCFISGIIVAFEWMGHDRGQRIYSMLKRPEIKEVEVIKKVYVPIIISNDSTIVLINQNYRDTMIKISGMWFSGLNPEKDFQKIQEYITDALKFPETLIREEK